MFAKVVKWCYICTYIFYNEVLCIYGDDDPYISQEMLHSFSDKLKAKEVIIRAGGHLNKNSGFNTLEEIMKYI